MFPATRLRRLRTTPSLRALVRETELNPGDFILPLFVMPGKKNRKPVASMAGVFNLTPDEAAAEAQRAQEAGVAGVILFGVLPAKQKDATGSRAEDAQGPVAAALAAIAKSAPELVRIADICLCEYTDHGHCGVIKGKAVDNDATLPRLAAMSVALAKAGAQVIAPSDMMDGRVAVIRAALDDHRLEQIPILSYAAKFASAFYGPFREAAGSTPAFGDRRGYQMDPANGREALREMQADVDEGADMLMVKPALPYLDILALARQRFDLPLAAYQVSGEYAMLKAAAAAKLLDEPRAVLESLTAIKRAGADFILTYYASQAAEWLRKG
jgi:porphobilinogen synthase